MLDTLSKIIAIFSATIGATKTIHINFFKDLYKKKHAYYETILKPFILIYKEQPSTNVNEFINEILDKKDDNIPKYITYLIDIKLKQENSSFKLEEKDEEIAKLLQNSDTLKKVLIYDYINLYPNERNKKLKIYEIVSQLEKYVLYSLSFIFIFIGVYYVIDEVYLIISSLFNLSMIFNSINSQNIIGGLGCLILGIMITFVPDNIFKDMYDLKKSIIHKHIKYRVEMYEKHIDKYVI